MTTLSLFTWESFYMGTDQSEGRQPAFPDWITGKSRGFQESSQRGLARGLGKGYFPTNITYFNNLNKSRGHTSIYLLILALAQRKSGLTTGTQWQGQEPWFSHFPFKMHAWSSVRPLSLSLILTHLDNTLVTV